jgi:hypothetical protein
MIPYKDTHSINKEIKNYQSFICLVIELTNDS